MVSNCKKGTDNMNGFLSFSELKTKSSPLAELSKSYDVLPDRILNKSLGESTMGMIPRSGGTWEGEPGNSTWKPDRDVKPKNRNYSNVEGKDWGTILDENGIDGIPFKDGEPDFSEVSKGTVEIDFTNERYGAGGNFDQADEKLAQQRGCTKQEVQQWRIDHNYTWHERGDCKTMDKVPREVHSNVAHSGGISKIKGQQ